MSTSLPLEIWLLAKLRAAHEIVERYDASPLMLLKVESDWLCPRHDQSMGIANFAIDVSDRVMIAI